MVKRKEAPKQAGSDFPRQAWASEFASWMEKAKYFPATPTLEALCGCADGQALQSPAKGACASA